MKWLQISDLHISEGTDWELMKQSYINNLINKDIDFIIITGDLHEYSKNYDETKEFLDQILLATNLTKDELYIVPGNHDVCDFDTKNPIIEYVIKHSETNCDVLTEYMGSLSKSFVNYNNFYSEYFGIEDYAVKNVELSTFKDKINIVKLNTAIISNGERDHVEMVDCLELSKLEIDNDLPIIVIGHHSIFSLSTEQQNQMKRIFTNLNVSAYLCGDAHKNSTKLIENFSCSNASIPCIVCGKSSINSEDNYSDNNFIVYNTDDNNVVTVELFEWSSDKKTFLLSNNFNTDEGTYVFNLQHNCKRSKAKTVNSISGISNNTDSILNLLGYVLIGPRGNNGIKYIWKKNRMIVESVAFNSRLNCSELSEKDKNISAYTCSISHGCILNSSASQCIFCESGKEFKGFLTAEDIALQNIFMSEYDSDCKSYPSIRNHEREFAYMGQGEPGYAYPLVRESIILTDYAMKEINQKISRYIISTCGITGFIPMLINDIESGVFNNKVTLHFSLNAIDEYRNILMPINRQYDYKNFIQECTALYNSTKEKIAVSIMIFNKLKINGLTNQDEFSLTKENLKNILSELNPDIFKIDLRDFNSNSILQLNDVSNEYAQNLLNVVKDAGFEAKLFSCFGKGECAALGMLNSSTVGVLSPGETTIKHYERAIKLLNSAKEKYNG